MISITTKSSKRTIVKNFKAQGELFKGMCFYRELDSYHLMMHL